MSMMVMDAQSTADCASRAAQNTAHHAPYRSGGARAFSGTLSRAFSRAFAYLRVSWNRYGEQRKNGGCGRKTRFHRSTPS